MLDTALFIEQQKRASYDVFYSIFTQSLLLPKGKLPAFYSALTADDQFEFLTTPLAWTLHTAAPGEQPIQPTLMPLDLIIIQIVKYALTALHSIIQKLTPEQKLSALFRTFDNQGKTCFELCLDDTYVERIKYLETSDTPDCAGAGAGAAASDKTDAKSEASQPEIIAIIKEAIQAINNVQTLFDLFSSPLNILGHTPAMILAQLHPSLLVTLANQLNLSRGQHHFSTETQPLTPSVFECLAQQNVIGNTAILYLANESKDPQELLDLLEPLSPEEQLQLLFNRSKEDESAILCYCKKHTDTKKLGLLIQNALETITKAPDRLSNIFNTMLHKPFLEKYISLMSIDLALFMPDVLLYFLQTIPPIDSGAGASAGAGATRNHKYIFFALCKTFGLGFPALMLVASKYPKKLTEFLKLLAPKQQLKALFSIKSVDGGSTLYYYFKKNPIQDQSLIDLILSALNKVPQDLLQTIFLTSASSIESKKYLAQISPSCLDKLRERLSQREPETFHVGEKSRAQKNLHPLVDSDNSSTTLSHLITAHTKQNTSKTDDIEYTWLEEQLKQLDPTQALRLLFAEPSYTLLQSTKAGKEFMLKCLESNLNKIEDPIKAFNLFYRNADSNTAKPSFFIKLTESLPEALIILGNYFLEKNSDDKDTQDTILLQSGDKFEYFFTLLVMSDFNRVPITRLIQKHPEMLLAVFAKLTPKQSLQLLFIALKNSNSDPELRTPLSILYKNRENKQIGHDLLLSALEGVNDPDFLFHFFRISISPNSPYTPINFLANNAPEFMQPLAMYVSPANTETKDPAAPIVDDSAAAAVISATNSAKKAIDQDRFFHLLVLHMNHTSAIVKLAADNTLFKNVLKALNPEYRLMIVSILININNASTRRCQQREEPSTAQQEGFSLKTAIPLIADALFNCGTTSLKLASAIYQPARIVDFKKDIVAYFIEHKDQYAIGMPRKINTPTHPLYIFVNLDRSTATLLNPNKRGSSPTESYQKLTAAFSTSSSRTRAPSFLLSLSSMSPQTMSKSDDESDEGPATEMEGVSGPSCSSSSSSDSD